MPQSKVSSAVGFRCSTVTPTPAIATKLHTPDALKG